MNSKASVDTTSQPVKLKKTLTLFAMVMMGLAYLQPMTVLDTFGLVSKETAGHVPTAYILALIAMLFTAYSYGQMVKVFPSAGSAYTYTQKTISPHLGFMVGWLSMLDYLLMPMINVLLARIYMQDILDGVPPWIFVVFFTVLMTYANIRGLELVSSFNRLIVLLQVGIVIVFTCLMAYKIHMGLDSHTANTLFSTRPFFSEHFDLFAVIGGATILCFSFLGFDGISSLSEETHDAEKNVPRAIFLTALSGGILFIFVAYVLDLYFPSIDRFEELGSTQPEIIKMVTNSFIQSVILVFSTATVIASGLASQAGISRLMYVMGRDGVLPKKAFGHLSPKYRTPVFNILLSGALCLVAIEFNAELGYEIIAFGALIAFTFVNISVFSHYFLKLKRRYTVADHIKFLYLPLCGVITVSALWGSLGDKAMILGLSWAAIGIVYMVILTRGFTRRMPELHETHSDEKDLHL